MKKFLALRAVVAGLFAVSCEGGLDLSGIYSPEHLITGDNDVIRWNDAEDHFMISPKGCDFSINVQGVLSYMQADLASMFEYEIIYPSNYTGEEWIDAPSFEEVIDSKYLNLKVMENTTENERNATVKFILSGDNALDAFYAIDLVQMPAGYTFPENEEVVE